jgi:hypothetical protein
MDRRPIPVNKEQAMNETTNSKSSDARLAMTLKVGAVVAVLSLTALTVEHPRFAADIADDPMAIVQTVDPVDADAVGNAAPTSGDASAPTLYPKSGSDYFPRNFAEPRGDAQPLPPTF